MDDKAFYTVSEVANEFGVTPQTVRTWIEKRQLRAIQPSGPNGAFRIPADGLVRLRQKLAGVGPDSANGPATGLLPELPLQLSRAEQVVLDCLADEERDSAVPRLARTYRRILELLRSDDSIDAILAAHLARDLVVAIPRVAGVAVERGHTDYEGLTEAIAAAWPDDMREQDIPASAVAGVRALLEKHAQAARRAGSPAGALIRQRDPGRAHNVADASVRSWLHIGRQGSDFAHGAKHTWRELPSSEDVRRLVDELTAVLLGALGPWFVAIEEVDRMLGLERPTKTEARTLVGLLATPSQLSYFYSRADERWLDPLVAVDRGFAQPPAVIPVEGGWQAPDWPQGRYLVRMAAVAPHRVAQVASAVAESANPRVADLLVDVALALPVEIAIQLIPTVMGRLRSTMASEYLAVDVGRLVQRLGDGGHPNEGAELLMAMATMLAVEEGDRSWHLEQLLDSLESVSAAGQSLGEALLRLLVGVIPPEPARKYSTMWLRNIDRKPPYGVDAEWMFANATYRFLLALPLVDGAAFASKLLADDEAVARRIALAAIAERPDLLESPDPLLIDVASWDDENSTRYEYRRALGAAWSRGSQAARKVLLAYAAEATEAEELVARAATLGVEQSPDDIRRDWRGRLLHRIAKNLPKAWLQRNGPLPQIADDRLSDTLAEWGRNESPYGATELAALSTDELLVLLETWEEPEGPRLGGPSLEALAATAGEVVPARLADVAQHADAISRLRPPIIESMVTGIRQAIRGTTLDDPALGVAFVLDVFERTEAGTTPDHYWELLHDVAGAIEVGANKGVLDLATTRRALAVLGHALEQTPTGGWLERGPSEDWDAGMVALNTVRGSVGLALADLLINAAQTGRQDELDLASAILRRGIAHPDGAIPIRAAVGLRLPWVLARDAARQNEWLALLLGSDAPDVARQACWQAYLLYAPPFRDTVPLLAPQYTQAVHIFEARDQEERQRPRDDLEQLGVHVAWAHVLGLPAEFEGEWLGVFYRRAPDWVRAHATRWIADQTTLDAVPADVRTRARGVLRSRAAAPDAEVGPSELRAMLASGRAVDQPDAVLTDIVLPALEKLGGRVQHDQSAIELVARTSVTSPHAAARALHLLVDGDEWRSMPRIAGEPLRRSLETLLVSENPGARAEAETTVHTLGAQGFIEYGDLLTPPAAGPRRRPGRGALGLPSERRRW